MSSMDVSHRLTPESPLVRGLGWFSIGLGLAEILAPRALSRGAGVVPRGGILRGYGMREIATGLGILLSRDPRPWLWGRVAGDALDVATVAASARPNRPIRLGATLLTLLGVGLADLYCAAKAEEPKRSNRRFNF